MQCKSQNTSSNKDSCMLEWPLSEEVAAFILKHREMAPDLAALAARKLGLPHTLIADQIKSLQKIKTKIPEWYDSPGLVLPESKYLEQASSTATAQFKAKILQGTCIADLTGGTGVDTWAFSEHYSQGYYLETREGLVELAKHNFIQLGMHHIQCHHSEASEWALLSPAPDSLFLDPSRRDRLSGKRVSGLENYEPNPIKIVEEAVKNGKKVLLKLSTMDSIPELLSIFPFCSEVYVLAVKRECKEILLHFKPSQEFVSTTFHAVELQEQGFHYSFTPESVENIELRTEKPLRFIYDLHPAFMKLGAYAWPLQLEGVYKLHLHTHLYTSEKLIENFPGRAFLLHSLINPKPSEILEAVPEKKAMVLTRNYPEKADNLLNRWKISEGGSTYLAACTLQKGEHKVLVMERVN